MKQETEKPSIFRIIWADYDAFYACLILIVTWVVIFSWMPNWNGDGPVIPPVSRPFFLGLATLLTLGSCTVLVRRIWLLFSTFHNGVQVPGKILSCAIHRDRGHVGYTYIYGGKEYLCEAKVHRTKQALALKKGERVTLVVDRSHPQRAHIRSLYI